GPVQLDPVDVVRDHVACAARRPADPVRAGAGRECDADGVADRGLALRVGADVVALDHVPGDAVEDDALQVARDHVAVRRGRSADDVRVRAAPAQDADRAPARGGAVEVEPEPAGRDRVPVAVAELDSGREPGHRESERLARAALHVEADRDRAPGQVVELDERLARVAGLRLAVDDDGMRDRRQRRRQTDHVPRGPGDVERDRVERGRCVRGLDRGAKRVRAAVVRVLDDERRRARRAGRREPDEGGEPDERAEEGEPLRHSCLLGMGVQPASSEVSPLVVVVVYGAKAHFENWEVSPAPRSVVVAVTLSWCGSAGTTKSAAVVWLESIVFAPRKTFPSPPPSPSQAGLEKSSNRYVATASCAPRSTTIFDCPSTVSTDLTTGSAMLSFAPFASTIPRPSFSKIELRSTASPFVLPVPASIRTPEPPLNRIVFAAAGVVPPIVLPLAASVIETPLPPFGREPAPARFVPIRLPSTAFPCVPVPVTSIPGPLLPDATFPAPAAVPPTVLFDAPPWTEMPAPFGAAVTLASSPTQFPSTTLFCAPGPVIAIPPVGPPTTMFLAAAVVPPTVLSGDSEIRMPNFACESPCGATAALAPLASVPT